MGGTESPDIDRYGALLVELHEAVVAGDASSQGDPMIEASRDIDTDLADRLASAEVCLRLLERMRLGNATAEMPSSPRADSPRSIGRFEIQRLLGQGTYGVVYLAHDPDLQRQVAIKVPRPEVVLSEPLRHRFLREAEAVAALDHAHIVPVYEAGQADGVYYMVMAYSPGSTLSQWLHQQPQLPPASDAARLVAKLADAVAHAHSRGVLHRDLKPANVLMQVRGGSSTAANARPDEVSPQDGRNSRSVLPLPVFVPLVTDFGLAKFVGDQSAQTHTTAIVGSPAYMAPEQASGRNHEVGASADVYALGAILYELLTGRAPFVEESVIATLDAVRTRLPPAPSRLRPGVPRDLEAICMKCLEKAPASRYRTSAELHDDLTRFLLHEPIVARRVSRLERFARWCRRDPLVATLSAAVALLAVCSTAAAFLLAKSRSEALTHLAAAMSAKEAAMSAAWDTSVAHARAALRSGNSGHRVESLRALRTAMHHASGLQLDDERRTGLRNDAIASLSLVDLELDTLSPDSSSQDSYPATDGNCERYVRIDGSDVLLCDMNTHEVWRRFALTEPMRRYIGFSFSDDGRYLGARFERAPAQERVQIWDVATGARGGVVDVGGFGSASGYTSDSRFLIVADKSEHQLQVLDLPALNAVRSIPLSGRPATIAVHPAEPCVACYLERGGIEVRDLLTGQLRRSLPYSSYAFSIAWSPNGRWLGACGRDGSVAMYDGSVTSRQDLAEPVWRREGHAVMAIHSAWHPDSSIFATASMDGVTRLWDADTGARLVSADGLMTNFSRDGQWLGTQGGRWRVVGGEEHRLCRQPESRIHPLFDAGFSKRRGLTSEINHWEMFPRGRLMIGENFHGAIFRDVTQNQPLAELELTGSGLIFNLEGTALLALSPSTGLQRMPVAVQENEQEVVVSIGPPEKVLPASPGMFRAGPSDTIIHMPFLRSPQWIDMKTGKASDLRPWHVMGFYGDISRDGRFLATGTFKGQDVLVRDARRLDVIATLSANTACPWFSPDNRLLAVAEMGRITFWDVPTWQLRHEVQTVSRGIWPNSMAFAADARMVALEDGSAIRLLTTDSFTPLAEFAVAHGELIESIQFTPDSRYLIAGGGDQHHTHIWDLARIRDQLRELGLDFQLPASSVAEPLPYDKPLRLELNVTGLPLKTPRPQAIRNVPK